jgi:hypothetical protein
LLGAVVNNPKAISSNIGKACGPVKCPGKPKVCPYGYQKKDGCEICKCNDPCNPPGKVVITNSFIPSLNIDMPVFISLYFVDLINDVLLKRKLMEHLELVVM